MTVNGPKSVSIFCYLEDLVKIDYCAIAHTCACVQFKTYFGSCVMPGFSPLVSFCSYVVPSYQMRKCYWFIIYIDEDFIFMNNDR